MTKNTAGSGLHPSEELVSADDTKKFLSQSYKTRLLLVLLGANILNFMDRAMLGAAIEPMRLELSLSDTQIGLLQGVAFGIPYALMSLPVGRLADRVNRKTMLICTTLIFSLMSGLCSLASSFMQLFALRAGVGAGEAAFMPPATSLLADHFRPEKRASAFSIISMGPPLGYMLGGVMGGIIVANWGWRAAFAATVVPGLVMALILLLSLREPPRGLMDVTPPVSSAPPPFWSVLRTLFSYASFRHLVIAGSLALFVSYSVSQFLFPYFQRVHGVAAAQAGVYTGAVALVAIGGGTLLGGFGVEWARKFDVRWTARLPAVGSLLSSLCYVTGFLSGTPTLAFLGATLGGISLFCFYAPTYSTVQNLANGNTRATAIGFISLVFGIVGAGLGPTCLGALSDAMASAKFEGDYSAACVGAANTLAECRAAASHGLRWALAATSLLLIWAGFHFWMASRTVKADLEKAARSN